MPDLTNHHRDGDGIGSAQRATSEWAGFGSVGALVLAIVSLVATSLVDRESAVTALADGASASVSTVPANSPSASVSTVPIVSPSAGAMVPIPPDLTLTGDIRRHAEAVATTIDRLDGELCSSRLLLGSSTGVTRFEKVTGPERFDQRGLLVFDGPAGAEQLMTELRSQAQKCTAPLPLPDGATRRVLTEPMSGPWDDGVALLRIDDGETATSAYAPLGTWLLAARRGSAVVVRFVQTEYYLDKAPTAIDGDFLAEVRKPLDAIAPGLCRWAAASATAPCR